MNFHTDDFGVKIHCLGVADFKDNSFIDGTSQLAVIFLNEMPTEELNRPRLCRQHKKEPPVREY